jgi:CRISPR type I-E-associated protein CasB/Cse2
MANLRRSLRKETNSHAWPFISKFCKIDNVHSELLNRTFFGVYAIHPFHKSMGNFGESLRIFAQKRGGLKLSERYLKRLVDSISIDEICERIPFIIRMLKNEGIPVNYERLYTDLFFWGRNKDVNRTPMEWCQEYYKEQ